jgi:hypothetical protein
MSDMPHLWDDEDMVTKQNIHGSDPGKRITGAQKRNAKVRMPPLARINFYKHLDVYIQHPNTAQKVRVYWKHLHEEAPIL